MRDYGERREFFIDLACIVMTALAVIVVLSLLTSCRTVYVPVESTHHDTLYVNKWMHDSVWIETLKHDSVVIKEKGDTVFVSRWHTEYVDRWRDREVHDTLVSIKVDSIQVPYPVERKLSFFEKVKIGSVGFVGALVVCGAVGIALWIRRRYKRI